ncbi:MAG: PKD domain-containing protein, partial [Firmicutes bacterium]|nr:PKD domain-containing protein [Bacillota bacterium]
DTYQTILPGDFEDGKTYYLYIQAQNHLGLTGPIVRSGRLLYDHTAPIVKIAELSGGTLFSGQYYLTNLSQLGVAVEASDPDSGIIKTEFALAEDLTGEIAQWHNTLNELKGNVTVNHGKLYYLVVRAVNGTQLTAIAYSEPIFIETTGPELTVETSSAQPDTGVYTARIQTRDPETMVTSLQYCIGTAPAKADLSTGLPGTENGWFSVNYPDQIYELRHYAGLPVGLTYYITVKATNVAGLITTTSSSGTLVSGPSVTAPEVSDDGYYTSEKTSLHFKWNFAASLKQIRGYEYQIRSSQGVIKSWTGYDPGDIQIQAVTPVSLLVTGLNLVNNTQYYCDVRAKYDDGNYSDIGSSDGILVDYTIPTITSFTAPAYAGSKGVKLDWQAADPESGVKCYLGLGMNPGEMDVTKGWISIGNLKTYQISVDSTGVPIQFENGRKYYATLMVENGSGLAVQQTSPAITIDLTPPPTPVVLDDGSYTNRADRLRANWKWTKPDPESGIREYLYTITTKRALSGGEFWFSDETETDIEFTNLNLIQGKTYYVVVKSVNNAGIESEPGFSNGILVDTTAPSPPLAVDSGDYSLSNNNLRVDLLASDAESGIEGYRLSLGTLDEPDKVFGEREILTESGLEHLDLDGLNLEEGQIYFFTVKAINRSSLLSLETSSDGIMVDSKRPKVAKITVQARYLSDPGRIAFDWQAENSPSGIIAAQYAISDNPNGSNLAWQDLDLSGTKVVSGLNLNDGATYYVYVRVQNRAQAENTPYVWSLVAKSDPLTIDQTPPEIIKINAPAFASQHFLLQWEGKDVTSGIVEYRYAVGSDRGATDLTGGWISLKTSDTSISFYRDDLPLGDKHSCYISVKAKNGAGLWSEVYKTDAIRTDLTPPVITKLEYGSGYLRSRDTIKTIIWEANDPDTGIAGYRIGMVEEKKNDCLTGAQRVPTDQTGGTIDLTGLTLEEGRTYYIALQIQNSVGDWSEVRYSQGITVDTLAPSAQVVDSAPELVTNSGELEIPVRVSEPCTLKVTLVYPNGREDVMDVSVPADIYRYHFSQTMEGRYTLSLTPTDPAGNPGDTFNQVIRLNAKPFANIGPDLKVTKGATVHFKPEVSDSDGTVVEYAWNFGGSNGDPDNTSAEANPYHTFKELGTYEVTLIVKDNDGKWSNYGDETRKAKCSVEVTNTYSGTLQLDEYWEGEIMITGNIIVPQGITLTIKPGTKIDFLGSYQILVNGKIIIDGTPDNQVMVGADTHWNGIRLEKADPGSAIRNATIRGASVGMVIYESSASITGSTFTGNDIGLHLVHSGPLVQGCVFQGNTIYGVKEDDSAQPAVIDCRFLGNGAADYYEDQRGIISIDTLNKTNGNSGNQ